MQLKHDMASPRKHKRSHTCTSGPRIVQRKYALYSGWPVKERQKQGPIHWPPAYKPAQHGTFTWVDLAWVALYCRHQSFAQFNTANARPVFKKTNSKSEISLLNKSKLQSSDPLLDGKFRLLTVHQTQHMGHWYLLKFNILLNQKNSSSLSLFWRFSIIEITLLLPALGHGAWRSPSWNLVLFNKIIFKTKSIL